MMYLFKLRYFRLELDVTLLLSRANRVRSSSVAVRVGVRPGFIDPTEVAPCWPKAGEGRGMTNPHGYARYTFINIDYIFRYLRLTPGDPLAGEEEEEDCEFRGLNIFGCF